MSTRRASGLCCIGASVLVLLSDVPRACAASARSRIGPARETRTAPPAKRSERLISLVLLLRAPRELDGNVVAQAIGEALDTQVPPGAVTSQGRAFLVTVNGRRFAIISVADPYFGNPGRRAAAIKDPNLGRAVREHRAWLSVDWVDRDAQVDLRQVYQQIGKITAQLVGADALAIYSPDTDRLHLNDETVVSHLKSDDPLRDLVASEDSAGVNAAAQAPEDDAVTVSGADELKLKEAAAEAIKRWPEFVGVFNRRQRGQYFGVKGPLQEGATAEYLWIQVTEIDERLVHGRIDNDPAALKTVARGADVHIPIDRVDDWLYTTGADNREIRGGFTLKVLDELRRHKGRKE